MARYFDRKTWSFNPEPPGTPVPTALVLLGAPLLGLVFAMFLPAAGFWLVARALLRR